MILFQSQLNEAILREDYGNAAKLKLAIAGAAKKDVVGTALTIMNVRNLSYVLIVFDFFAKYSCYHREL